MSEQKGLEMTDQSKDKLLENNEALNNSKHSTQGDQADEATENEQDKLKQQITNSKEIIDLQTNVYLVSSFLGSVFLWLFIWYMNPHSATPAVVHSASTAATHPAATVTHHAGSTTHHS